MKLGTAQERNLYENTLKQIAEHPCEDKGAECVKSDAPSAGYCCPCLARATLKSQKN